MIEVELAEKKVGEWSLGSREDGFVRVFLGNWAEILAQ